MNTNEFKGITKSTELLPRAETKFYEGNKRQNS